MGSDKETDIPSSGIRTVDSEKDETGAPSDCAAVNVPIGDSILKCLSEFVIAPEMTFLNPRVRATKPSAGFAMASSGVPVWMI